MTPSSSAPGSAGRSPPAGWPRRGTACSSSSVAVAGRPADFPREPGDAWRWDDGHPERESGWIDFRIFRSMAVAQGAAVGGGSLIYANISLEANPATFDDGWPPEITYGELAPHYAAVGRMMNVQAGAARPVAGAHVAHARGGDRDRARRPVPAARPRGELRPGLGPGRGRPFRPRTVAPLHQCRGDRAGDLRPPRGVRHRLPGPRPQHARPQLHPAGRAPRRGGPAAPRRARHRTVGRRLPRPSPTGSRRADSCRSPMRPGSSSSPPARLGRPSCSSAAATWRRRCRSCRRRSARAGAATATS